VPTPESFEDLDVAPELIEALAADGIERPTPLQEAAVPVLRRGNNLVLAAGPGSGLLVAWAIGLLERLPSEGSGPHVLALTATRDIAERLAESFARLAAPSGRPVAALGSAWVLPERAHILFGTPADTLRALADGELSLEGLTAFVVDQAQLIEKLGSLDEIESVLDFVPHDAQRVLSALPLTPAAADLANRHFKRSMTLPAAETGELPRRGGVRFRIVSEPREHAVLDVVGGLLPHEARHVLVFCQSEDHAADLGDYLSLHGFMAGAPGDPDLPVWLGVDALEARAAARGVEDLVVVSANVPSDPDTLDRRHGISPDGVVLLLAREVPHFRDVARRTGYDAVPFPPPARQGADPVAELRRTVERALETEDIAPYLHALAPLFERHDPAEVAAATVALLRRKGGVTAPPAAEAAPARGRPATAPAWAKLFVGVGSRDGLVPGDLLGAITGEAGVGGDAVGRIDIKESHSLVEVHDAVAQKVIRAINGTTIKGRAARVDFDRPRGAGAGGRRPAGGRRVPPRRS
jgi:ATP-dependent RNA helicase DeaD